MPATALALTGTIWQKPAGIQRPTYYLAKKPAAEIEIVFPARFSGELGLVPGHRGLTSVPQRLESTLQAQLAQEDSSELDTDDLKNEHRERLKNSLNTLRGQRDVVFIDTPPDLGFLMTTALIAADFFIIPVFPSGYDLKGLETLMRTTEKVQKRFNPDLRLLGVLLGNYDTTAKLDSDINNMLSRKFGKQLVFDVKINRSVKHREATVYGRTIFEHAPEGQPAAQFVALVNEVAATAQREGNYGTTADGGKRSWLRRKTVAYPRISISILPTRQTSRVGRLS